MVAHNVVTSEPASIRVGKTRVQLEQCGPIWVVSAGDRTAASPWLNQAIDDVVEARARDVVRDAIVAASSLLASAAQLVAKHARPSVIGFLMASAADCLAGSEDTRIIRSVQRLRDHVESPDHDQSAAIETVRERLLQVAIETAEMVAAVDGARTAVVPS